MYQQNNSNKRTEGVPTFNSPILAPEFSLPRIHSRKYNSRQKQSQQFDSRQFNSLNNLTPATI